MCSLVQIISYTKGSISVGSSQFKGRVGFTTSMPSRDVSLYINNTQESDSGRYVCQVISPDNPGNPAELLLDVKGKTLILIKEIFTSPCLQYSYTSYIDILTYRHNVV